jgi:hypothetical protein
MLCPLSVPSALWWTTSLQIITLQVFIVGTFFAVLRYVRAPSAGRLVAVGSIYCGALFFWEKALLIFPLVVLFVFLFLGEGTRRTRLRNVSARLWHLWATLGGITAAYVVGYLLAVPSALTYHPTLPDIGRLAARVIGSAVIPTYLGGPWSVSALGPPALNELSLIPRAMTWGILAAIVVLSLVIRRQAWRAWILPATYLGILIGLVGLSNRLAAFGLVIALYPHHVSDSVPVFALALALAFMVPLDRRTDPAWGPNQALRSKLLTKDLVGGASNQGSPRWLSLRTSRILAVAAILGYATSAMVTSTKMAGLAHTYSTKRWFTTVKSELATHPTASIVDSYLPPRAITVAFFPEAARASHALGLISPSVRWNGPDEHPLMFDDTGHLQPAEVTRSTAAEPGPTSGCGYLVAQGPVTARLVQPLFAWEWGVRLGYFTQEGSEGLVTVDGDRQRVRFLAGLHGVTIFHAGTATSVTIETHGAAVCVGDIVVGIAEPASVG